MSILNSTAGKLGLAALTGGFGASASTLSKVALGASTLAPNSAIGKVAGGYNLGSKVGNILGEGGDAPLSTIEKIGAGASLLAPKSAIGRAFGLYDSAKKVGNMLGGDAESPDVKDSGYNLGADTDLYKSMGYQNPMGRRMNKNYLGGG